MDQEEADPNQPIEFDQEGASDQLVFVHSNQALNTDGNEIVQDNDPAKGKDQNRVGEKLSDSLSAFNVESEEEISNMGTRRTLWVLFWASTLFMNLDTGVIPTAALPMERSLDITKGQIAFLAGIAYLGTAIASLFVSPMMKRYTAKSVIIVCEFGNAIACLVFAYNNRYLWLSVSRFIQGVFQAFIFSYSPVWINHFAPRKSQSTWMSV